MKTLYTLNKLCKFIWHSVGVCMVIVVTLLAILLVYTTIRGLPQEFQFIIRTEFRQRGIYADWDFMGLDPLGRVSVKNFRCRGFIPERDAAIIVRQALFDVGWLALVRREQILKGVRINNASFNFITSDGDNLSVDSLDALVIIAEDKIVIQELFANSGSASLSLDGDVPMRFFQKPDSKNKQTLQFGPATEIENPPTEKTTWENYFNKLLQTAQDAALNLQIKIIPRQGYAWDAIAFNISAQADQAEFDNIKWEKIFLEASWDENLFSLHHFTLTTDSGRMAVSGIWKTQDNILETNILVSTPLESLSPFLPDNIDQRLRNVTTHGSFTLEAQITLDIVNPSNITAHGHLEWFDVILGEESIHEISIPFHVDSGRLQIPQARFESGDHSLLISASSKDISSSISSIIQGSINPSRYRFLLPEATDFFDSTKFTDPVKLNLSVESVFREQTSFTAKGDASVGNMSYKGVTILSASCLIELNQPVLKLQNIRLQRPEGVGTAQSVEYNFQEPNVLLTGVTTKLLPNPTARIFGPKLEEYLAPYIFTTPPNLRIDGFIDLATEQLTDLKIFAEGKDFTYNLLGRAVTGENFSTQITLKSNRLDIVGLKGRVDGGNLDLKGSFLLEKLTTPYELSFALRNADLSQVMLGFFNLNDITGRVTGGANISGKLEDLRSIRGEGEITVRDGSLIDIPFLGALSEVAGLFELGKARASEADATFKLQEGKIITADLDIRSVTMALIGNGHYDFVDDNMELDIRLNIRGPAGILLFPVSKLFEYRGTGSLAATRWEPRIFTPAVPIPSSTQGSSTGVRGRNR